MGKVRAKPTRIVAKPFRKKKLTLGSPLEQPTSSRQVEALTFVRRPTTQRVTKKKHMPSALKKTDPLVLGAEKKSVTFASSPPSVHVFNDPKTSSESLVKMVLKEKAGGLLNLITGGRKGFTDKRIFSKKKQLYTFPEQPSSSSSTLDVTTSPTKSGHKSIGRIVKNQFKEKKARKRIKKEAFKHKLVLIQAAKEEMEAQQRRKATVIVGDMQPMTKVLDELQEEQLLRQVQEPPSPVSRNQKKRKLKDKEQEMLEALRFYETTSKM